jgi:8-oxo-dGTP pyrophosphatase MutT (NUDIX family)
VGIDQSAKFLRPSRLPKERQKVAAVCYRIRRRGIEFLLVQTRGGRWIFPKGGVESGLSHAQSAALEAFEEAGVHGRMEQIPFARYFRRKPRRETAEDTRPAARSSHPELAVAVHLCEVSRLEPPQEVDRNPTWFSAEKAKQRLLEDRAPEFGAELARVVDRASARIRRLQGGSSLGPVHARLGYSKLGYSELVHARKDALQEVRFEASELARVHGLAWSASYARYIRREYPDLQPSAGPPLRSNRPTLRLESGTPSSSDTLHKVQFIDKVRPTSQAKAPAKSAKNRQK